MEQIQLSNFSFEGDNNVYLFDDGPETVLVDTGDWMDETREQLATGLKERGLEFADIDRIFLTHWHGDHVGLASPIQAESDAEVYVHEADAPLVAGDTAAWEAMGEKQRAYFDHWRMPEEEQEILEEIFASVEIRENPPDVTPITDGETFSFNDVTLRAVHAPGHAAGLCMYVIEDGVETDTRDRQQSNGRDVLSGDALLPKYTPNVGGADVRVEQPLAKYLQTLGDIAEAGYDRAWPGHREVIEDPTARAEFIIHHHEERAWRVLDALRRLGPADAWTVSADLFGELEHIHILHGPGESYAHLEHLEHEGTVVCEGSEYRLADGVADEIVEADEQRWPLEA